MKNTQDDLISRFKSRKDRRSKDLNREISKEIDDEFYKKFYIKPRSEGIFTTSDIAFASNYGKTYMIFPIGEFDYIWSDEMEDLFNVLRIDTMWYMYETDESYRKDLIKSIINKKYFLDNDGEYYDNEKEMKITYLNVKKEIDELYKLKDVEMSNEKYKWMNEFTDSYKLNTGFCDALSSNSEISIICDEYYLVDVVNNTVVNNTVVKNELFKLIFDYRGDE